MHTNMKIVINTCHGGFGLSVAAIERIAELQGRPCFWFRDSTAGLSPVQHPKEEFLACAYDVPNPEEIWPHHEKPWNSLTKRQKDEYSRFYQKHRISDYEQDRTNPLLVQVVEELGEKASGLLARLKVIEIPDDVDWEIDDYDGRESVHEKHRSWS
jgi:hypothetical protein